MRDRKEAGATFVSLDPGADLPSELWAAVREEFRRSPEHRGDERRLHEILEERRERSRSYFESVAPRWDAIGSDFESGVARERVVANLISRELVVADVGSGTGYLSAAVAPLVAKVILVDHAPAMLEAAREALAPLGAQLEFRRGEIDALPLDDGEVDAITCGMVLHHVPDPAAFLREAWRVLRPGGTLVIQDLLPHAEATLREVMADLRLGLNPDELARSLEAIGFRQIHSEIPKDRYRPECEPGQRVSLPLFLLRAHKGACAGANTKLS